ncbi:MAG: DUF1559 domain-containing protein [Gemmataceae bacterium]|nr:DUF1559 domain-containing protein [Gemmataceae bacterium]
MRLSNTPRAGVSRLEAIVVVVLIVLAGMLLIPSFSHVRPSHVRSQSMHNLRNIVFAVQGFHDVHKRLPFNGVQAAIGSDDKSGSWAFQILPYIDQKPLFERPHRNTGVAAYMCPGRGRPSTQVGLGAWTDYFLNNYINDPANASKPDNPDCLVTMASITDGTSSTLFVGHGNISTRDYSAVGGVVGSHNIFAGGSAGTMRAGPDWVKGQALSVSLGRDTAAPPNLKAGGWGSPYAQGALMGMGDGTVRMFPYATAPQTFGEFLTPTGAETPVMPDF